MMLTLIDAKPTDALRLAKFAEKTYRQTFSADNRPEDMESYVASAFGENKQREELEDPNRRIILALEEGELVGYYQLVKGKNALEQPDPKSIELMRLYVDARWHGQGIAHQLMRAAMEESKRDGFETLWLGVWENNFRALAFYKKWEFSEVGNHVFMMGADAQRDLLLARKLT